jgi:hypothetical protein
MQGTPNSTFNPAAVSFNPGAPTFQPSATKPPIHRTMSVTSRVRSSTQMGGGISSPEGKLATDEFRERRGADMDVVENPFRPHWDGVFGELSAPRQSPTVLGESQPPPHSTTLPTASGARGSDGATPYYGHERRSIGHAVRPSMTPAGGWGFDSLMELDIHALMKAQNKTSTPSVNALGVGLGVQFTEEQWQRLGAPIQPIRKDSGIENQHGAALGVAPRDQCKPFKAPIVFAKPELTHNPAIYPPTTKLHQLPQVADKHDVVTNWRTHLSDYSDETVVPIATPPIFQPVPTSHKPAFLPPRVSETPLNHVSTDNEPVDYSKHHRTSTGRSAFYQQLPQNVATPSFSYGDYRSQRYGTQLIRPSTTKSQARSQRGKPLGRRRIKVPRMKRTDQGPMPSSADIYPDDARVGSGAPTYPNLECENPRVGEANGNWNDAEGARGPTAQWTATVHEELRRQAEAEALHNEYLRSEEVARELEELVRSQEMHHRENMHHHEDMNHHYDNNTVNDYGHTPIHINMPPSPGLVLSKPHLPLETPVCPVDKQSIMLPSPLPTATTKGHSTNFSVFNPAYYRTANQVKASMEAEPRPISPAQLDGSRYGMRFWGIGIGDSWDPVKVAPGTKFRVRPREHEGWGGWEWVKEYEMVKDEAKKMDGMDRIKDLWDKEV